MSDGRIPIGRSSTDWLIRCLKRCSAEADPIPNTTRFHVITELTGCPTADPRRVDQPVGFPTLCVRYYTAARLSPLGYSAALMSLTQVSLSGACIARTAVAAGVALRARTPTYIRVLAYYSQHYYTK